MIGRRLINSLLTRFMHTCAFFFVSNTVVLSRVFHGQWFMC
jgi:preprotein translocase subunit SecG